KSQAEIRCAGRCSKNASGEGEVGGRHDVLTGTVPIDLASQLQLLLPLGGETERGREDAASTRARGRKAHQAQRANGGWMHAVASCSQAGDEVPKLRSRPSRRLVPFLFPHSKTGATPRTACHFIDCSSSR